MQNRKCQIYYIPLRTLRIGGGQPWFPGSCLVSELPNNKSCWRKVRRRDKAGGGCPWGAGHT